jgi:hypothetical protein
MAFTRDKPGNGVNEPDADPDPLIIGQDNKPVYPLPAFAHGELNHARMRNNLAIIDADELPRRALQAVV